MIKRQISKRNLDFFIDLTMTHECLRVNDDHHLFIFTKALRMHHYWSHFRAGS